MKEVAQSSDSIALAPLAECTEVFLDLYGNDPTHAASAPGRLNFIGEHIDYNDGIVLPAAIEKKIVGVFGRNDFNRIRVYSVNFDSSCEIELSRELIVVKGEWSNYIAGVVAQFRKMGVEIPGFDVVLHSDIPVGGGLSSSAALEVIIATMIETLLGLELDGMKKALMCQMAEHEYAGVPCGIMDQAAVVLCEESSFLKLDCRDLSISNVRFDASSVSILVVDTRVHHNLADGEYGKRRSSCERALRKLGLKSYRDAGLELIEDERLDPVDEVGCVRHVITEIARTNEVIEALGESDFERVGACLNESHRSLSEDYRVSCDELDFVTDLARQQEGVYGSRMTGGGFGGSAIVFLKSEYAEAVADAIAAAYKARFDIDAGIFATSPAGGAKSWLLGS